MTSSPKAPGTMERAASTATERRDRTRRIGRGGCGPEPPHLTEAAAEWSAEEVYWIVENGIKMSGMPAFEGRHGPQEIAALTAFVSRLPGLSPRTTPP